MKDGELSADTATVAISGEILGSVDRGVPSVSTVSWGRGVSMCGNARVLSSASSFAVRRPTGFLSYASSAASRASPKSVSCKGCSQSESFQ